jgi:hypothetical protein
MAVLRDFVMNLPHEYYPALGEFMFRVAQLEMQLHEILWRSMNIGNRDGRILTIGSPAKAIRGMLRNVVSDEMKGTWLDRKKNAGLVQGIEKLLNKAKPFADLRNKIAHGCWQSRVGSNDDVQLLFIKEQDEKYLARVDPKINAAYIHQQCKQLKSLNLMAKQLSHDLHAHRGYNLSHIHSPKDVR